MNNTILKKIIIIIFIIINTTACSTLNHIIYQPIVYQGNYFNKNDLIKIHPGMKKKLVISILGTPMLYDISRSNTYYYIYYKKPHYGKTIQKTLTLKFDNYDTLISINYKKLQK